MVSSLDFTKNLLFFLFRKYEEVYPPEVDEFVYITDDTYTKKQLLRMEHLLLKVLGFDLTVPTTHQFLMLYLTFEPINAKTAHLALVCCGSLSMLVLGMMISDRFSKSYPLPVSCRAELARG